MRSTKTNAFTKQSTNYTNKKSCYCSINGDIPPGSTLWLLIEKQITLTTYCIYTVYMWIYRILKCLLWKIAALLRDSSVALCPIQVTMTQHYVNLKSLMSKQSITMEGSLTPSWSYLTGYPPGRRLHRRDRKVIVQKSVRVLLNGFFFSFFSYTHIQCIVFQEASP